jgi:hypothetical protein
MRTGWWTDKVLITNPVTTGARVELAPLPEFTFVLGCPEEEELAVFVLDEDNRQAAGDLWYLTGARLKGRDGADYIPRHPMQVDGTLPAGVTLTPKTGRFSYNGLLGAAKVVPITVRCGDAVRSTRLRMVTPTIVWGEDAVATAAARGWTGARCFAATQVFNDGTATDVQSALNPLSTDDQPNVVFATAGTVIDCSMSAVRSYGGALYFLGDPANRPEFSSTTGGQMGLVMSDRPVTTFVVRNIRNSTWKISVGAALDVSQHIRWVISKVTADGSVRTGENYISIGGYGGSESKTQFEVGSVTLWYYNCEAYEAGGSALRHTMYVEGRPNTTLHQLNVRSMGGHQQSILKSTQRFHTVAHNVFATVRDLENPTLGKRASKFCDIISAAEICVFNNDFYLLRDRSSGGLGGTPDGALFWRRRETSYHGCDEPPSCDRSYAHPASTIPEYSGHAVGDFPNTAATYANPAFWAAVREKAIDDPDNPYTFKKYVAWNNFHWIAETTHRRPPFRDDGVAPHGNYATGGAIYVTAVPPGWLDRSITFFANNSYFGWEDAGPFGAANEPGGPDPFININDKGPQCVNLEPGVYPVDAGQLFYDQSPVPPGWYFPPPTGPRAVKFLGGDVGPHTAAVYPEAGGPPVRLPPWFRLCAA